MTTKTYNHPSFIRLCSAIGWGRGRARIEGLRAAIQRYKACSCFLAMRKQRAKDWVPRSKRFPDLERAQKRLAAQPSYRKILERELRQAARKLSIPPLDLSVERVENWLGDRERLHFRASSLFHNFDLKMMREDLVLPKLRVTFEDAHFWGIETSRRGKNFSCSPTYGKSRFEHAAGETTWKHGLPKSYERARNDTYVRSFARPAKTGTHADIIYHESKYRLAAPVGYRWGIDTHGLNLYSVSNPTDNYHPSASECWKARECAQKNIVERIEENRARRIAVEAEAMANRRSLEGVYVCIADSRRAGNCESGSLSFCEGCGFDARRHYPAVDILQKANGDTARALLACRAAAKRQAEETQRGYSILSEHRTE